MSAVLVSAALCGCGTDSAREARDERAAVPPANYRPEILAFMKTYLNNPTGVRDAFLAEPALKPLGTHNQYVVCVRYNARNTDGKYMGNKEAVALFDGGRFDHMIDQFPKGAPSPCADAEYKPFPELEAVKR